jgi:hypothetical protein
LFCGVSFVIKILSDCSVTSILFLALVTLGNYLNYLMTLVNVAINSLRFSELFAI